jgi:26S proteasome regulatory subunit N6
MAVSTAENSRKLAEAEKLATSDPSSAEKIYKSILSSSPGATEAAVKNVETALVGLGELYRDQKRAKELAQLILQTRSALSAFAKAKTAKLGSHSHPRKSKT